MKLIDLLAPENVVVDLRAADKATALAELAQRAGDKVGAPADAIVNALLAREKLGSTGVGGGVAIPHARLAALARPFALFARLRAPIAFDAVDGRPVDLLFLLLLPDAAHGEQMNALACAARALRDPAIAEALRKAKSADAAFAAIAPG